MIFHRSGHEPVVAGWHVEPSASPTGRAAGRLPGVAGQPHQDTAPRPTT